jgi:hypothetical protein
MARWQRLGWFVAIWAASVAVIILLGQAIRIVMRP